MQITVYEGTWELERALEAFTTLVVPDNDEDRPLTYFILQGLQQNSYYELETSAFNDIGSSDATNFIFKTAGEFFQLVFSDHL